MKVGDCMGIIDAFFIQYFIMMQNNEAMHLFIVFLESIQKHENP
jgi:hypothetical protein